MSSMKEEIVSVVIGEDGVDVVGAVEYRDDGKVV